MISHAEFGKLRLTQFLSDMEITELEDWEFEGRLWVGQAIGFSEWLRPAETPTLLRSLALDFSAIPADAASRVLSAIQLGVFPGMTLAELMEKLGTPEREFRFVPGRVTAEFTLHAPDHYKLSCTVVNDGGLTHLGVLACDES